MTERLRAAAVRVPSSTSNLGSGYDTLGLALDRYLVASFEPGGSALECVWDGALANLEVTDSDNLLVGAFTRILNQEGSIPCGVLRATSDIPISRGLGSSAAAVLAGYDLARAVLNEPRDDEGAFVEAHRQDGHGENAAACLHGGLCAVVHYLNNPVIVPLNLSSRVGFAYAAPLEGVSTRKARRILPKEVGHDVAVRSLGRAITLVQGFALGDPELIRIGVEDELHVPYRLPLIDSAEEAIAAGYEAGAWAVTISGAGSGIIAMCDLENTEAVSDAMCIVLSLAVGESNCLGFSPAPDHEGLTRLS